MKDLPIRFHSSTLPFDGSRDYVEELYQRYQSDPTSVTDDWQALFTLLDADSTETPVNRIAGDFLQVDLLENQAAFKQSAVLRLINAYRVRGHQQADIDPIGTLFRPDVPDLDPAFHHLTNADMDTSYHTGSLFAPDTLPLRDIIDRIRKIYTGSIGAEYMHIASTLKKRWIQQRLEESIDPSVQIKQKKIQLLERLTAAEGLERYLNSRYVGQKRFSLEGGESMIPLLDELLQHSGRQGVKEIVLGMAHRGRLNVLINTMGKAPDELFREFEGKKEMNYGSGDVKYHMGFSSDIKTDGGPVHLALAFNPSHLEVIDPVVIGAVKARQHRCNDDEHETVLPVLIHGDASFSGQGVVMETLNMSLARGFHTGGTIHLIHNNQIGFTTSHPMDARSTPYCTEVAKMVEAPIFHVNGDDPEAVIFITRLALDYRKEFKCDVVLDMICYRRHGHSEADEPSVTQPVMYSLISSHPTTRESYARKLQAENIVDAATVKSMQDNYYDRIHRGKVVAANILQHAKHPYIVDWSIYRNKDNNGLDETQLDTSIELERIRHLSDDMQKLPAGFTLHPRVAQIVADRQKMASGGLPITWGFAEAMAYASLLDEGFGVRLSGQDSGRGTFFHRHAILSDQDTGDEYIPLQHIGDESSRFQVINSLLSEEAVLGFELGYATAEPATLVIWEAQFGDFANGAQVFIDQFISSAKSKWDRLTGLTLFLPHGLEGQGPEHSSARLERFLQLCAEYNMRVCVPTTAAQIFHLLRTQMLQNFRRPLIVMSPKSMLRNPLATSSVDELANSSFRKIIPENKELNPEQVCRIILCTGKVYYDLFAAREEKEINDIAIIRIEQLYPFPRNLLISVMAEYPEADSIVWCQEEPMNQGAWYQIRHHLEACTGTNHKLSYCGRVAAAAPAAGSYSLHMSQMHAFVDKALKAG
ncbi:MAG: 2-oxoglutarate dehydrogenase E1 component [Pseudomonadota bacterium]|nr:2-oxoglutarate dehydrogenase E1 component [Pseudomonadota bacterium]